MKLIQKANKQLRVDDVRAEALLKIGYVEIDEKTGKPVKAAAPEWNSTLPEAFKKVKAEVTELRKENKELKAQVKDLTAQLEAVNKPAKE